MLSNVRILANAYLDIQILKILINQIVYTQNLPAERTAGPAKIPRSHA